LTRQSFFLKRWLTHAPVEGVVIRTLEDKMLLELGVAREVAEAMLDAIEMAQESNVPVAVIIFGGIAFATKNYDLDEATLVVVPEVTPPRQKRIRRAA
jgi:sugar phosphate isomerase/epimerase